MVHTEKLPEHDTRQRGQSASFFERRLGYCSQQLCDKLQLRRPASQTPAHHSYNQMCATQKLGGNHTEQNVKK